MITHQGDVRIVGVPFADLDLRHIEFEVNQNKYVQNAEVFKDLKGNLIVNINQSRPVARLISRNIRDRYISNYGEVLPVSERYTARVMIISGAFAANAKLTNMHETETGKKVFELIRFVQDDPFWKAQVAELEIDKKGDISIYTQVSKQKIEFGQAENIEEKFRNLKIFYQRILPAKGWNTYDRVSVKFKNQIVCE
jgi:cell division protein FtsQ